MSGITHLISAVRSHEAVSVEANICSANVKRSGRNQNPYQKDMEAQIKFKFTQTHLLSKLCRNQNSYQKGLPT